MVSRGQFLDRQKLESQREKKKEMGAVAQRIEEGIKIKSKPTVKGV
jgi:hypothetical protein